MLFNPNWKNPIPDKKEIEKANFNKLINALRSGKYEQCTSLVNNNKVCALGLAALEFNLATKEALQTHIKTVDIARKLSVITGISQTDLLIIANRNDEGHTFKQLAEYLEKWYR